ncbi:MAG: tetratricopeptide repeat protein [Chitinivibrionales bacterium]|nr:tetratricopeptide repeat protein [Chitinivibrionales bacterium]
MASNNNSPETQPAFFEEENARAEEYINEGDLPGAAQILVDIVDKDPQNARAYNNMGIISWMRKAWEDAYAMFTKAAMLKPDYADVLVNLLDAALKLRRIPQALPLFEKAIEVNPDLSEIRVIVDSIKEQGDEIYTSERGLIVGTFNKRIDEANQLLEDSKLFEAMDLYLKVNDEEGPHAEVFSGLGIISFYQERFSDAYTLFLESLKLNPLSTDTYLNLLDAAREIDKVAEARAVFKANAEQYNGLKALEEEFDKA